jgi:nucleoside-specific outer membrane channel protein Tsx
MTNLLRACIALALVVAAPAAKAGGFSTTNVQLLQGYDFNDPLYYTGGTMTTLTLNTFSTWEYGDSFFFADMYTGHFKDGFDPAHPAEGAPGGQNLFKLYAEWHPRLFVDALLGQKEPLLGVIRHWGPAGEINVSQGFGAYLGGVGFDFAVPAGWVLGLNAYYRWDSTLRDVGGGKDKSNQWQLSPFWTVPFALGPVPFVFTGFVDVNGTWDFAASENFTEVWAQPQLLVDVLAPFGGKPGKLFVGTEWFYHRHPVRTASVPQAMVQWTVF